MKPPESGSHGGGSLQGADGWWTSLAKDAVYGAALGCQKKSKVLSSRDRRQEEYRAGCRRGGQHWEGRPSRALPPKTAGREQSTLRLGGAGAGSGWATHHPKRAAADNGSY